MDGQRAVPRKNPGAPTKERKNHTIKILILMVLLVWILCDIILAVRNLSYTDEELSNKESIRNTDDL